MRSSVFADCFETSVTMDYFRSTIYERRSPDVLIRLGFNVRPRAHACKVNTISFSRSNQSYN